MIRFTTSWSLEEDLWDATNHFPLLRDCDGLNFLFEVIRRTGLHAKRWSYLIHYIFLGTNTDTTGHTPVRSPKLKL